MSECIQTPHGSTDKDGYKKCKYQGQMWFVHRLVYTLCYGEIEPGLVVGHSCNNPGCVNIAHLYLCTPKENSSDAARDKLYLSGDKHPKYKITNFHAKEMVEMYDVQGYSQQAIADYFGFSQSRVSEIIRNNR